MGKQEKQDVFLMAENNSVGDGQLDTGIIHIESMDTGESWKLDPMQQCRDSMTGRYVQYIGNSHYDPIKIYRSVDGYQPTNDAVITRQTVNREIGFTANETQKNRDGQLLWLGIIVAMLTFTVCVIGLIAVLGN